MELVTRDKSGRIAPSPNFPSYRTGIDFAGFERFNEGSTQGAKAGGSISVLTAKPARPARPLSFAPLVSLVLEQGRAAQTRVPRWTRFGAGQAFGNERKGLPTVFNG